MTATIDVSDWHIDINDPVGQSVAFPGQERIKSEYEEYVTGFSQVISEMQARFPSQDRFVIRYKDDRYRLQKIPGTSKYATRRIDKLPSFSDLKMPRAYQDMLTKTELSKQGGLILFCGQAGSGKTSSAVATIKHRLENHGGFCLTVEDPPEYELRGFHGERGYCEQIDVSGIGYEVGLETSLRCFPSKTNAMLFFGEIRSRESAMELLNIAVNGQLVIATIHSKDISSCIQRLLKMAGSGEDAEVRYLLSASLKLVIHQHLNENSLLQLSALQVDSTVASIISGPNMNLVDAINRTNNQLKSSQAQYAQ